MVISEITLGCLYFTTGVDSDINGDEEEEKQRLISQVLELQNTLDGNVNQEYYLILLLSAALYIIKSALVFIKLLQWIFLHL